MAAEWSKVVEVGLYFQGGYEACFLHLERIH